MLFRSKCATDGCPNVFPKNQSGTNCTSCHEEQMALSRAKQAAAPAQKTIVRIHVKHADTGAKRGTQHNTFSALVGSDDEQDD